MRICVCAWVQCIFTLLGVDDIHFVSLNDNVCKWNWVVDVLVLIPGNNGSCTQAPVDDAGDNIYGILIT